MDFQTFQQNLKSDAMWWEQMQQIHKGKDFELAFKKVYGQIVSTGEVRPEADTKSHIHNILCGMKTDPVQWWKVEPVQEQKDESWKPLTGQARAQRLAEFMAMVQAAPMLKPAAPISTKELLENSDWRPKPPEIHEPSELEKHEAALRHAKEAKERRTKLFLEAWPDASQEEIEAYVLKFRTIDDPNNVMKL
jgi:hypothetical protein